MRVTGIDRLFVYDPTAKHCEAPAHDTPLSPLKVPPFGVGVSTTAQDEPFQNSEKGQLPWLLSVYDPTARQRETVMQEIALSALDAACCGRGLGMPDQDEPFHNSVRTPTTSLAL
jgi:hypothetical protein